MEHILNLEQVKKYYGGNSGNITKAVDGISMYVDKGEFVRCKYPYYFCDMLFDQLYNEIYV